MFFIVPKNDDPTESANKRKRMTAEPETTTGYYPKRNPRACDRCRLKKAKCSGERICAKCMQDGVVCVTSHDSKSSAAPLSRAYVHLVESQRDHVVQALCRMLKSEHLLESAKIKNMLAEMGIATETLRMPRSPPETASSTASGSSTQPGSKIWDDVLSSLDVDQLQQIESICTPFPMVEEVPAGSHLDMGSDEAWYQNLGLPETFQNSQPEDSKNTYFWAQDATLSNHFPQEWDLYNNMVGERQDFTPAFDLTINPAALNSGNVSQHTYCPN